MEEEVEFFERRDAERSSFEADQQHLFLVDRRLLAVKVSEIINIFVRTTKARAEDVR